MKASSNRKSLIELREEAQKQQEKERAMASFRRWFEPHSYDETTGASVGGHHHARRRWVNDEGVKRWYGLETETAFGAASYYQEWLKWKEDGEPTKEPFVSIGLPREEVHSRLNEVIATLGFREWEIPS